MVTHIFHERQRGGYCRLHALNNLVGKQICTPVQFDKHCDNFDILNKFSKGTSKSQLFYNNGNMDNIFGYILNTYNYDYEMKHYEFCKIKNAMHNSKTVGYILYTKTHALCIKNCNGQFYLIDSMKARPQLVNPVQYCKRRNLGVIQVYKK